MNSLIRALKDQHEQARRRSVIDSLIAARQERPDRVEWLASDLDKGCGSSAKVNGSNSQAALRATESYRRRYRTTLFLDGCRRLGAGRLHRKPLPWAVKSSRDCRRSGNDMDPTALAFRIAASAAAALTSVDGITDRIARCSPPQDYDSLFQAYSAAPAVDACMESARRLGVVDAKMEAKIRDVIPSTNVRTGILAVQNWRRDAEPNDEAAAARDFAMMILESSEGTEALRSRVLAHLVAGGGGVDPWVSGSGGDGSAAAGEGPSNTAVDVALCRRGRELREGILQHAQAEWQRLDEIFKREPKLRRFVFGEACCMVEALDLRECIMRLRPGLLSAGSVIWVHLTDMAVLRKDPNASAVLELSVKGLVMLHGSDVADEHLDPLACAVLTLLVLLLDLGVPQLRKLAAESGNKKGGDTTLLLQTAAALHDFVQHRRLADKPYRHLSPAHLYDMVCNTAVPEIGAGDGSGAARQALVGADSGRGGGGAAANRRMALRYSDSHLIAMLHAMAPENYVRLLAEAAMVRVFAGSGYQLNDAAVVEAMQDALAVRVFTKLSRCDDSCNAAGHDGHDDADGRRVLRRILGTAGCDGGSGDGSGSGGGVNGFTSAGAERRAAAAAAAVDKLVSERGPYEVLYDASLRGARLVVAATTMACEEEGRFNRCEAFSDRPQPTPASRDLALIADSLIELKASGLGLDVEAAAAAAEKEEEHAVGALRGLLRCGVQAMPPHESDGRLLAWLRNKDDVEVLARDAVRAVNLLKADMAGQLPSHSKVLVLLQRLPKCGADEFCSVVEALRPGLLAAHPNTWGKLMQRAGNQVATSSPETSPAWKTAYNAICGLAALGGQELPLPLLGLSYCVVVGVTFCCDLERYGPRDRHEPYVTANLLFRWLLFVPSFLLVTPERDWMSAGLMEHVAAQARSQQQLLHAADFSDRDPGGHFTAVLLRSFAVFTILPSQIVSLLTAYMMEWGLDRWHQRQRREVLLQQGGLQQPQEIKTSLTVPPAKTLHARRLAMLCSLAVFRSADASVEQLARLGVWGSDDDDDYADGADAGADGYELDGSLGSGSDLDDLAAAEAEAEMEEALADFQATVQKGKVAGEEELGLGLGLGLGVNRGIRQVLEPQRLSRCRNLVGSGYGGGGGGGRGGGGGGDGDGNGKGSAFVYKADGDMRVKTKVVSAATARRDGKTASEEVLGVLEADVEAMRARAFFSSSRSNLRGRGSRSTNTAATKSAATAYLSSGSGGSSSNNWRGNDTGVGIGVSGCSSGGSGSGGGSLRQAALWGLTPTASEHHCAPATAATAAAAVGGGGGPAVLRVGCGPSGVLPLVAMCEGITDDTASAAGGERLGGELAVEGAEAAALLMLMLIHIREVGRKDFLLHPFLGDGAAPPTGAAAALSSRRTACRTKGKKLMEWPPPAPSPPTLSSMSSSSSSSSSRPPPAGPNANLLRLSLRPGHSVKSLVDFGLQQGPRGEPQRVTVSACSKVSQQLKLVRKALLDEKAGVFELRTQGIEGLQRAMQLAMQVCSDMRAVGRDVIMQPTAVFLHDTNDDAGGGGSGQHQQQGSRVVWLEVQELTDKLVEAVARLLTPGRMGLENDAVSHLHRDTCWACANEALSALWGQLVGGGVGGESGGGGGDSSRALARTGLCFWILLAECELGRPGKLVSHRRGREGVGPLDGRAQLARTMMFTA